MSEITTIEPKTGGALTPMEMLERALTHNAAPETLERLLGLQERWEASQARKAFDGAMADLRGNLPEIIKSSEVDFTSSKGRTHYRYEDLGAVTRALSPVMAGHGLSFRWRTKQENGGVIVTCIISHRDGHYEETSLQASPDNSGNKNSIQAIGSTVTYLQRYTLKAAVGVAASYDDDAQSVSGGAIDAEYTPMEPRVEQRSAPAPTIPKAGARDLYQELQHDIDSADSVAALEAWSTQRKPDIDAMPPDWKQNLRDRYAEKKVDLIHGPATYNHEEQEHVQ